MENDKKMDLTDASSEFLAKEIVKVLVEKKAIDVRLYNAGEDNSVTDYYVNATGRSSTNVLSLADDVTFNIGERGRKELRLEGRAGREWMLVDYGDVIVNIFDRSAREFYNFDRLLSEENRVDISDAVAEVDKKYEINKEED